MGKVNSDEKLKIKDVRKGIRGKKSSEVEWLSKRNGITIGSKKGP